MSNLPNLPAPADLTALPGVKMQPPPPEFAAGITQAVETFANATLKDDQTGGFVGVLHRRPDGTWATNLAIVQRTGEHGAVVGWLAKDWGEPVGGGLGWTFRW